MLRDPFIDEAFIPDLMWFIGSFNVYDREDSRGVELEVYDPNNQADRAELIRKYSLNLNCLSYRHKFLLVEALANKLADKSYDFQRLFDIDEDEASSWPRGEWYALESPRAFLQNVYELAQEVWKDDLLQARAEDQSAW
ncbi:hypothetical protein PS712_05921 [Pseudomonas fluorescens]|jgi:hypothetical protein|uniref:Uncharacterized protein n=1 Tax=Pseudomonas fluorescens TaxID=294 RepID=A0A5E7FQM6_PSEFL|nr:hypothetical protein [Pseudomonas fluorescens]VVO41619.1 hypothetical protein PS712_05921 [Pseudomonas fluorescens]